ncbi:placenta-specific gene 8 protein-like [Mytilus californianus]|uniref:placenta-specific gene 8 protein-like n=1 Tax=Mytilus californianus TaxID=6549 RepID=UPI0022477B0B|nr:placenta-specific gene 8 protein-like [Mytilus californianus]
MDPKQSHNNQPPPQHMGRDSQVHPQHQQQNTTVVINQPGIQTNPLMIGTIHGTRGWSTELFDCFGDVNNCLYTGFCYSCAMYNIAIRLGESSCTMCCVPAVDINIRTRIRTLGGIQGDMCNDCMIVAFCGACAACQENRELRNMGL